MNGVTRCCLRHANNRGQRREAKASNQQPINDSLVKISPAIPKISRNKKKVS